MGRIYELLTTWLRENDWTFDEVADEALVKLGYQGGNARWQCLLYAPERNERLLMYAVCPILVPEDKRPAMAEFLCRVNQGLVLGNFELDWSDGEVRYKTSFDANGAFEVQPLFPPCIHANLATAERYFPGLMAVVFSGQAPEEAVAACEA